MSQPGEPSLIEQFINHTSGGREAGRVLLREYIFYMNTKKWPDHLGHRRWRVYDSDGEKTTWVPASSEHRD